MPIGVKKVIVGRLGLFGEHCIIIGYLHQALFGSWWRYMGRIRLCKRRGISLRNWHVGSVLVKPQPFELRLRTHKVLSSVSLDAVPRNYCWLESITIVHPGIYLEAPTIKFEKQSWDRNRPLLFENVTQASYGRRVPQQRWGKYSSQAFVKTHSNNEGKEGVYSKAVPGCIIFNLLCFTA